MKVCFLIKTMLIAFIFTSCNSRVNEKFEREIIYIKECDGVYEYDSKLKKSRLLFALDNDMIIIESPFKNEGNDTLIGFRAKSQENDSIRFYVNYYDLQGELIQSQYLIIKPNYLIEQVTNYFINDMTKVDTFKNCKGSSSSVRFEKYDCIHGDDIFNRFYYESQSKIGNKVYSEKGNIFLEKEDIIIQITTFTDKFNPKFGNGYYEPIYVLNDDKILFRELGEFMSSKNKELLYCYEVLNQNTSVISTGTHSNMKPSNKGDYILFSRSTSSIKSSYDCKDYQIIMMDLETNHQSEVAIGYDYIWCK